jgi:hypothetical protein
MTKRQRRRPSRQTQLSPRLTDAPRSLQLLRGPVFVPRFFETESLP